MAENFDFNKETQKLEAINPTELLRKMGIQVVNLEKQTQELNGAANNYSEKNGYTTPEQKKDFAKWIDRNFPNPIELKAELQIKSLSSNVVAKSPTAVLQKQNPFRDFANYLVPSLGDY